MADASASAPIPLPAASDATPAPLTRLNSLDLIISRLNNHQLNVRDPEPDPNAGKCTPQAHFYCCTLAFFCCFLPIFFGLFFGLGYQDAQDIAKYNTRGTCVIDSFNVTVDKGSNKNCNNADFVGGDTSDLCRSALFISCTVTANLTLTYYNSITETNVPIPARAIFPCLQNQGCDPHKDRDNKKKCTNHFNAMSDRKLPCWYQDSHVNMADLNVTYETSPVVRLDRIWNPIYGPLIVILSFVFLLCLVPSAIVWEQSIFQHKFSIVLTLFIICDFVLMVVGFHWYTINKDKNCHGIPGMAAISVWLLFIILIAYPWWTRKKGVFSWLFNFLHTILLFTASIYTGLFVTGPENATTCPLDEQIRPYPYLVFVWVSLMAGCFLSTYKYLMDKKHHDEVEIAPAEHPDADPAQPAADPQPPATDAPQPPAPTEPKVQEHIDIAH